MIKLKTYSFYGGEKMLIHGFYGKFYLTQSSSMVVGWLGIFDKAP